MRHFCRIRRASAAAYRAPCPTPNAVCCAIRSPLCQICANVCAICLQYHRIRRLSIGVLHECSRLDLCNLSFCCANVPQSGRGKCRNCAEIALKCNSNEIRYEKACKKMKILLQTVLQTAQLCKTDMIARKEATIAQYKKHKKTLHTGNRCGIIVIK